MERIIRHVSDLNPEDRQAIERILGTRLSGDEELSVRVEFVSNVSSPAPYTQERLDGEIPDAWKICDGLGDDEIDRLDRAIRRGASPTRASE